jgi:hypothetical protein
VEVDEKTCRAGVENQPPETREPDESQSTKRNPRRLTQRSAQCSGYELPEVPQVRGEDSALHPMDTEIARNPNTQVFNLGSGVKPIPLT